MKERPTHRQGDIRGMCQYPLALLSERPPADAKGGTLTFTRGQQRWTLIGSERHGFPRPLDMEVYVALLTLTRRQGYPRRNVFGRRGLLELMQWPYHERYLERLTLAFERWFDLMIKEKGVLTWPEAEAEFPGERWLRVLSEIDWHEDPEGECAFVWHERMLEVIRTNDFVHLDPALYFRLKKPLSKAIYRYRCGRLFDDRKEYAEDLLAFATERLGMTGKAFPSQVQQKLAPALAEMEPLGMGWTYRRGKGGKELIVFPALKATERPQAPVTVPLAPAATPEAIQAPNSLSAVERKILKERGYLDD